MKRKQQMRDVLQKADEGHQDDVFEAQNDDADADVDNNFVAQLGDLFDNVKGLDTVEDGSVDDLNTSTRSTRSKNVVFSPGALERPEAGKLDRYISRTQKAQRAAAARDAASGSKAKGGKGKSGKKSAVKFFDFDSATKENGSDESELDETMDDYFSE